MGRQDAVAPFSGSQLGWGGSVSLHLVVVIVVVFWFDILGRFLAPVELTGFSMDVMSRVLEVITGKDLGDVLKERVFDPLGM